MQITNEPNISNQTLLTIAIPTYNRAMYLDICLKRIWDEIVSLSPLQRCLVKVYVSDNASADDTPEVIVKYEEMMFGFFKGVRNNKNMGMDFNFSQCYEAANSPYVWVFGDDDVLLPGGLAKVLNILIDNKIDLLYVNNYWFQNNYLEKPRKNEIHSLLIFKDALGFARRTNVMLTFLSGLIVRSGIGQHYRNEMDGSNLIQLSWVLPLLRDGKKFAVIEDWVVAAKGSNSGGYGLIKVFGENLQKICSTILVDKPVLAKVIENGTIVNFFPSFVLVFRNGTSQFDDKNMIEGLRKAFNNNWRYYVFLAPLVHLPIKVTIYYNVFLKFFRRLFGWAVV